MESGGDVTPTPMFTTECMWDALSVRGKVRGKFACGAMRPDIRSGIACGLIAGSLQRPELFADFSVQLKSPVRRILQTWDAQVRLQSLLVKASVTESTS